MNPINCSSGPNPFQNPQSLLPKIIHTQNCSSMFKHGLPDRQTSIGATIGFSHCVMDIGEHDPSCAKSGLHVKGVHATLLKPWGCGAVGSASEWHSEGQGFESLQLHQNKDVRDANLEIRVPSLLIEIPSLLLPCCYRNRTRSSSFRASQDLLFWSAASVSFTASLESLEGLRFPPLPVSVVRSESSSVASSCSSSKVCRYTSAVKLGRLWPNFSEMISSATPCR